MIIVEKVLKDVLDNKLSEITQVGGTAKFTPSFDFGTPTDLTRFLDSKRKEKAAFYPLIWLDTNFVLSGNRRPTAPITLVLAVTSNHTKANRTRLVESFEYYLQPLFDDLISTLDLCKSLKIVQRDSIKTTNYYNYGSDLLGKEDAQGNIDTIWDAIKLEITIELTGCQCG